MNGNILTVIVVVASAILNFLLTQPPGTFTPQVLLVIGAASIGLTTLARFLPSQGAPVQVEVASTSEPIHVTTAPKEDDRA
jgi:hypothetical protein